MKPSATLCVLVVTVCITIALTRGASQDGPKREGKNKPEVILRFVSENDAYWEDHNPPLMVQLNSDGTFVSSEGNLVLKDLTGLLRQTEADKKKNRPAYLLVDVTNEQETTLPVLIGALNKLRASAPPDGNAVIFIRVRNLARFPSRGK